LRGFHVTGVQTCALPIYVAAQLVRHTEARRVVRRAVDPEAGGQAADVLGELGAGLRQDPLRVQRRDVRVDAHCIAPCSVVLELPCSVARCFSPSLMSIGPWRMNFSSSRWTVRDGFVTKRMSRRQQRA